MKLRDVGFTKYYNRICVFKLDDVLREVIRNCPDVEGSSHVIVYSYVDPKNGLMFEVLGAGKKAPKYFYFKDPYQGESISLQAEELADLDFDLFNELDKSISEKYAPRIETLKKFRASDNVEQTRRYGFLDVKRNLQFPDDVAAILYKEGLKPEQVWVTITDLGEKSIVGTLLNEPFNDYGVSQGDTVQFNVVKTGKDKGELDLVIDLAASISVRGTIVNRDAAPDNDSSEEDLLKSAIKAYARKPDRSSFESLISILKNSFVCVPGEMDISDEANSLLNSREDFTDLTEDELQALSAGMTFYPAELGDENHIFFPVFSSREEAGDKDGVSIYDMPFLFVMDMILQDVNRYSGIVINGFTDKVIIDKEKFGLIRKIKAAEMKEPDVQPDIPKPQGSKKTATPVPLSNDRGVSIHVGKMDLFNYALYHNDCPPIRNIEILNKTGDNLENAILRITCDIGIFSPYEAMLPPIPSGDPVVLEDPPIIVNGYELSSLSETINANVTVELLAEDKVIASEHAKMKILAYDQWQGSLYYRDLLPAFVLPNHPVVAELMHDVSEVLKKKGKNNALEGYQSGSRERVDEFACAAYEVIKSRNIVYANPPASFLIRGQRIRTPETIIEQKLGTCMDMTLLYAALLEAIGLHVLLILLEGHIYAGYWNKERTVEECKRSELVEEDPTKILKLITGGISEISFVECTCMCSDKKASFEEAKKIGYMSFVSDMNSFRCAIDVFIARYEGIIPIPSRIKKGNDYKIEPEDIRKESGNRKGNLGTSLADDSAIKTPRIRNKKDLWESKLLDLSSRNMLLNLPRTASVLPLLSSGIAKLEDALSDGNEFSILPIPEWLLSIAVVKMNKDGKPGKPQLWIVEELKKVGAFEITQWPQEKDIDIGDKIRQEYRKHKLYSFRDPKALDGNLTTIYRAARNSQQENGVSSLCVAIGLLRWFDEKHDRPYYAPLILVPVELVRKSANAGYALHMRSEDPHFNTTLIEMLKQKYNLDLSSLNTLPSDEHGLDVNKTFSIVRSAVYAIEGWNVIETCVLGNFSFAQFSMWNDIHTAGALMDSNKMVRSLMKGHVDWDTSPKEDDVKVYCPITVDGSQLQAIKMAAQGNTFVLHGPPGTGKSQTITGMIANLLSQGKKVLFVAEKKAALEVVQDRLEKIGLGDFCLEIHSDKADKKVIMSKLETALNSFGPNLKSDYEEYDGMASESRSKLDGYAEHLHQVQKCGYSLRMLIAQYELVRDEKEFIKFSRHDVEQLSYDEIKTHPVMIDKLLTAGEGLINIDVTKLTGIRLSGFNADVRNSIRGVAERYKESISLAFDIGTEIALILGTDAPRSLADLLAMDGLISLYNERKGTKPVLVDLLADSSRDLVDYLKFKESVQNEKDGLLKLWHEEFLDEDMDSLLAKYDATSKKLIGKTFAINLFTDEIQSYAYIRVAYPEIPKLLKQVKHYQKDNDRLREAFDRLSDTSKKLVDEFPDIDSYNRAYEVAHECQKQADKFPGGIHALMQLADNSEKGELFGELAESISILKDYKDTFNGLLSRTVDDNSEDWAENEIALCDYLIANPTILKEWGIYNQTRGECFRVGLKPVVDSYESGLSPAHILDAYKKGIYYALINSIISRYDDLSSFSGATFNEAIAHYKKLDDQLLEKTKKEIARQISSRIPTPTESAVVGTEINLLRKAISSNARGISLRVLFDRIQNILYRLCPCMLMSPNSVSQYLPQMDGLFDVVIFDEASQLPTCKAIGSLMRSKDAVIVGDPKQMPPTSFFAGGGPEVEDFALADLDSILDDVLALGIPSQHLQWHYRSQHESLIAFSNSMFYKNKMFTFPSANDRECHVKRIHVDGVYKKSTNLIEAEEVVAEVYRRYSDPELKKQSVGVVTFNMSQQALIENLLAKQFLDNPDFDAWANNGEWPLFVKNLENVQGDERDAIIFSICYGPDERGKVSNNFGPINKPGGEKRLNVAFSRARISMTVITSMNSTDIRVKEDSSEGVKAFHSFLRYVEGHGLRTDDSEIVSSSYAKAGIMQRICSALNEQGYICDTMVGHSDFHLDIAVINPYEPNKYLLGIMLDGDGYRQTKNTRDREVAQISVLKSLGWKICRVWAMDWWDNREREIAKLLNKLEILKAEAEKEYQENTAKKEQEQGNSEKIEEEISRFMSTLEAQAEQVLAEAEDAEKEDQDDLPDIPADAMVVSDTVTAESELEAEVVEDATPEAEKGEDEEVEEETSAVEIIEDKKDDKKIEQERDDQGATTVEYEYQLCEYKRFDTVEADMDMKQFVSPATKKQIASRIEEILDVEAPILKETLMKRVLESYKISKTQNSIEAFEKAFKYAKVKSTKLKGTIICWNKEQDPKSYYLIRTSADRSCDEICLIELANAFCYVLKHEGPMTADDLVKRVSLLLGYKRLGKNVEACLINALKWARSSGAVACNKTVYSFPGNE